MSPMGTIVVTAAQSVWSIKWHLMSNKYTFYSMNYKCFQQQWNNMLKFSSAQAHCVFPSLIFQCIFNELFATYCTSQYADRKRGSVREQEQ